MIGLVRQWAPDIERYDERDPSEITTIVLHRSGPWPKKYESPSAGADITRIFTREDLGTGMLMPYHYVIGKDAEIYECVPWWRTTPHAAAWNGCSIGVAILGDFRVQKPDYHVRASIIMLCRWLQDCVDGRHLNVAGHTSLENSTSDLKKVCPGDKLDVERIREDLALIEDWSI